MKHYLRNIVIIIAIILIYDINIVVAKPDIVVKSYDIRISNYPDRKLLEEYIEKLIRVIEEQDGIIRNISIVNTDDTDKLICFISYESKKGTVDK